MTVERKTPSFEEAVKIAKEIIAPSPNRRSTAQSTAIERVVAGRIEAFDLSTESGYEEMRAENYGAKFVVEDPGGLLDEAGRDYFNHLALRRGIASALEAGETIDPKLVEWLTAYLRDESKIPSRPKGQPPKLERQFKIFCAVQYLKQRGLRRFRNLASKHQESACDAVAAALEELGMSPRLYESVKRIYEQQNESGDWTVHLAFPP